MLQAERKLGRQRLKIKTQPCGQNRGGGGGAMHLPLPQVPELAITGNISSLLGPLMVSHTAPFSSLVNGIR